MLKTRISRFRLQLLQNGCVVQLRKIEKKVMWVCCVSNFISLAQNKFAFLSDGSCARDWTVVCGTIVRNVHSAEDVLRMSVRMQEDLPSEGALLTLNLMKSCSSGKRCTAGARYGMILLPITHRVTRRPRTSLVSCDTNISST